MTHDRRLMVSQLARLELRANPNAAAGERAGEVLAGYGAVYFDPQNPEATQFQIDYDLVERFLPGCFGEFLAGDKRDRDCLGCYDHDSRILLARRSSGTLALVSDAYGLSYSIAVDPSDPDHQSVAAKVRRGDVSGSSLRFLSMDENWTREGDVIVRSIRKADVLDVGPTPYPAYPGANAEVRNGGLEKLLEAKKKFLAGETAEADALLAEIAAIV